MFGFFKFSVSRFPEIIYCSLLILCTLAKNGYQNTKWANENGEKKGEQRRKKILIGPRANLVEPLHMAQFFFW